MEIIIYEISFMSILVGLILFIVVATIVMGLADFAIWCAAHIAVITIIYTILFLPLTIFCTIGMIDECKMEKLESVFASIIRIATYIMVITFVYALFFIGFLPEFYNTSGGFFNGCGAILNVMALSLFSTPLFGGLYAVNLISYKLYEEKKSLLHIIGIILDLIYLFAFSILSYKLLRWSIETDEIPVKVFIELYGKKVTNFLNHIGII